MVFGFGRSYLFREHSYVTCLPKRQHDGIRFRVLILIDRKSILPNGNLVSTFYIRVAAPQYMQQPNRQGSLEMQNIKLLSG